MSCLLCDRIEITKKGQYPYLIHEFKNSFLYLGEHQFFKGYSILVSKNHYREMTDLPLGISEEFYSEMMKASRAINEAFLPKKMNMCSLGNRVDHIHWHYFPRYDTDPRFFDPPWLMMDQFDLSKVTPREAQATIEQIRHFLI